MRLLSQFYSSVNSLQLSQQPRHRGHVVFGLQCVIEEIEIEMEGAEKKCTVYDEDRDVTAGLFMMATFASLEDSLSAVRTSSDSSGWLTWQKSSNLPYNNNE